MENLNISKDKFQFANQEEHLHDKKFETKQVGYFRDAFNRFCRNKASIFGAVIVLILVLYAIFVPLFCSNNYTERSTDTLHGYYQRLLPKVNAFEWAGWDGCETRELGENSYLLARAIGVETGLDPIKKVKNTYQVQQHNEYVTQYEVKYDTYYALGMEYLSLTEDEYKNIQNWQNENGIQVIFPAIDSQQVHTAVKNNANYWFKTDKATPLLDEDGNFLPIYRTSGDDGGYDSLRIEGDDGSYRYAKVGGDETAVYQVRVCLYNYFIYEYGFEPAFAFGTDSAGLDILYRLAEGARFSFIFSICIAAINFVIGTIYGAIEGYYGGAVDLTMERFADILNGVPFVVVTTLFQLHLASKVGVIPALLFAFVSTGWIGMAATTRMQFYRYKNQEYVLAARTLGAKDRRVIWKHIFPNALGTIITSFVLVIPSVIFSESSLTYLGIVNLNSSTTTSVGTMLAQGKTDLMTYPHIILFPALFISLLMICFNLFGNGLRDAFNPSLRGVED